MKNETFRQQCIRLNGTITKNTFKYDLKGYEQQEAIEKICGAHVIHSKCHAYCSHCGSEVRVLTQKECPVCHKKWDSAESVERPSRVYNYGYLCHMTVMEGLQVLRFWYVGYWFKPGRKTDYYVREVERQFIRSDGERKGFALSRPMSTFGRYDAWNWSSDITIRETVSRYYGYYGDTTTPRFDLPCAHTVVKRVIPLLRRNGLRKSLHGTYYPVNLVRGLLTKPQIEQLWKIGQYKLAEYAVEHRPLCDETMASVRICHRNHYRVKDAKLWIDHILTLRRMHLDIRNAHYVCPKNLEKAHQEMVNRQNRRAERQRRMERAERYAKSLAAMNKERTAYVKRMGAILSLSLSARNLRIRPLQTVDEFAEEGLAMNHCVFENRYYNHKDCLILSAKDSKGNRLATIEYDMKRGTIEQCRAASNGVPERDEEIRNLITSHRQDFERLLKAA